MGSEDVAPVWSCRSGWRLAVHPQGIPRPAAPQQLALPLGLPMIAAPQRTLWEHIKAFWKEDLFFAARTPY